jgi:hypothetical protein
MADALAAALVAAARDLGDLPPKVLVRDAEVASALAARLGTLAAESGRGRRPLVEAGAIPGLDEAAYAFVEHATGKSFRLFLSRPETWAAWGLPEELVAVIFRHAAAFHRAAPWQKLANEDMLTASMPGGNRWTACVLGAGGEEYGLNLYSEPDDLVAILDAWEPEAAFREMQGRIISLTFDARADLPKAMRRELAGSGWEIAGPQAHPQLVTINSPAGGLRRQDADDLAALLAAIPRFVAAMPPVLSVEDAFAVWRDEPTGIELTCHSVDIEAGEAS